MTHKPIPTFEFSPKYLADIPFQIIQFEDLPHVATMPFPRRRSFYEIFWIKDGRGVHHIDFEIWDITPNTLHFVTPRQVTFWEIQQDISGYAILFTVDFLAMNLFEQSVPDNYSGNNLNRQSLIHINEKYHAKVNTLCEQMLLEYNSENYGRFTLLQCQLTTLLIYARRHQQNDNPLPNTISDTLITSYQMLIEAHFHTVKTIHEYAEMLNITAGHLRDVTREKLGISPSQLLNKRIILESKRLLTYSEKTVAEIGQQLQFDDPSYFSRFFRRETGLTPTAFRQQIREKYQHPLE